MELVWERNWLVVSSLVILLLCGGCSTRDQDRIDSVDSVAPISPEHVPDVFHEEGFFALYADNRASGIANYITPDFLALAYTELHRQVIQNKERGLWRDQFASVLSSLESGLQILSPSDIRTANVRFVTLLNALLHGDSRQLDAVAAKEYRSVLAADGNKLSPLDGIERDYSQFSPRGHYSGENYDERYFRAMRYATTTHFGLVPSPHSGITQARAEFNLLRAQQLSAVLVASGAETALSTLMNGLQWHFGVSEDLSLIDVAAVTKEAPADFQKSLLSFARSNGRVPQVFDMHLYDLAGKEESVTGDSLIGWRLIPGFAAHDSRALQQLVYRGGEALEWRCAECPYRPSSAMWVNGKLVKALPSALELLALHGSEVAEQMHQRGGHQAFTAYDSSRDAAVDTLKQGEGHAALQRDTIDAWTAPDTAIALNGGLGFWVLQKHASLLYQKRSTTVVGKGFQGLGSVPPRAGGVIAREPAAFSALAELAETLVQFYPEKGATFAALARRCATLSANKSELSTSDGEFLNRLDLELKSLGLGSDVPVAVDIHNAANRSISVATGYPRIWRMNDARGAGFSVYEFTRDRREPLDDTAWQAVLSDPATAPQPFEFETMEQPK